MRNNTKTKQIKICTWNVCLGILHKIHLVKEFVLENNIDILCIQEAEVKTEDNMELFRIHGYSLEIEKTSEVYTKRSVMYIKDGINYQRLTANEKENAHVICIRLFGCNLNLASIYQTYMVRL